MLLLWLLIAIHAQHSFLMEHTNLEETELIRIVQLLVDNKLLNVTEEGVCLEACQCTE